MLKTTKTVFVQYTVHKIALINIIHFREKFVVMRSPVADSRGRGCRPLLTGRILKQAKILHENALFCIKISNIFWGGGYASSQTPAPTLPPHISNFLDPPLAVADVCNICLLYTSPSPRDRTRSRMPSSA